MIGSGHQFAAALDRLLRKAAMPVAPFALPLGAPRDAPPCIRHLPFGIAGERHRLPFLSSPHSGATGEEHLRETSVVTKRAASCVLREPCNAAVVTLVYLEMRWTRVLLLDAESAGSR